MIKVLLSPDSSYPFEKGTAVQEQNVVLHPVLDQLVYMNEHFDISGGLLESYLWKSKDSTYDLVLREGLTFHNGRKVNAHDLEFSLLRGFFSPSGSFYSAFFGNIEGIAAIKVGEPFQSGKVSGVSVVDERTVRVKLKSPNPSFLHSLAKTYFSIVPMEELKGDYESWKRFPVGAGKYKVKSLDKNHGLTLTKVVPISGNEPSKIVLTRKNDKNTDLSFTELKTEQNITYVSKRATRLTGIYFNYNSTLGADKNFRQAVSYALNRDELISGISSYRAGSQFLASHFPGRSRVTPIRDVKLGAMLANNILPKKRKTYKVPVFNSSFSDPLKNKYLPRLKEQLLKVGISVEFFESKKKSFSIDDSETPFRILSLGADIADPLVLFALLRGNSPLVPHFPANDKKYDELFKTASEARSMPEKLSAIELLSNHLIKEMIVVPLIERKLEVNYSGKSISDVGNQFGGLTFYLDKLQLK